MMAPHGNLLLFSTSIFSPRESFMSKILANNYRYRRTFAKTLPAIDVENLIAIQLKSYEQFLQKDVAPKDRKDIGLQAVFKSVFPISDFSNRARLHFKYYESLCRFSCYFNGKISLIKDIKNGFRIKLLSIYLLLRTRVGCACYDGRSCFPRNHI